MMVGVFKLPPAIATLIRCRRTSSVSWLRPLCDCRADSGGDSDGRCAVLLPDALFGERRDRSVLFWKSMPVSDRTAVLAKVAVPMLVVPALPLRPDHGDATVRAAGQCAGVGVKGLSVSNLLQRLPLLDMPVGVAYLVVTLALWYAPSTRGCCWCLPGLDAARLRGRWCRGLPSRRSNN